MRWGFRSMVDMGFHDRRLIGDFSGAQDHEPNKSE
jgi:hypothetical protein